MITVVEYQGKTYKNTGKYWVEVKNNLIVSNKLRDELNKIAYKEFTFEGLSLEQVIEYCDQFKVDGKYKQAIEGYIKAIDILGGNNDLWKIGRLLSKINSVYRAMNNPKMAIECTDKYIKMFGNSVINPALCTSRGAAYCDLMRYEEARHECNKAYAILKSKNQSNVENYYGISGELTSVYGRIKKESGA